MCVCVRVCVCMCPCVCLCVCGAGNDELSRWWSAVLAVCAHWLTVSDDESSLVAAQRFFSVVDSVPKSLHHSEYALCTLMYEETGLLYVFSS